MNLVLASRDPEHLEAAAGALRETGRRIVTVPCDVADRVQVYALAQRVKEAFGKVDFLCAVAGATTAGRMLDHNDADWDWSIDVNFRGITNCVQAFLPDMAARGEGTIMLTASQTAIAPDWVINHGPYVAAKAAVVAFATNLRAEVGLLGVTVQLFIPAGTNSDIMMTARRVPDENGAFFTPTEGLVPPADPNHPFMMEPEEVAARAVDGLRRKAPIVVTHAAMKPIVEHYFGRILAAYDDAARFKQA
jgi:short-subunit dehydrogenase